jgi:hypothetical protein
MDNLISKAIEHVRGNWGRHEYVNDQGQYCGMGALGKAMGLTDEQVYDSEMDKSPFSEWRVQGEIMSRVAEEQFPERITTKGTGISFPVFNDHPSTTEDDVILVMEKAAIKFEETVE